MGSFKGIRIGILIITLIPLIAVCQEIKQDSITAKIDEIVILSRTPISERYSSTKIDKLDIYFNPVSNGDALRAIFALAASTNTSETANPTLRGAKADQSRVFVNGVPILNPVRNSQDNGLGNFSLFNTELLHSQYIYASNPPLNYGNSSAGIVDITTTKELDNNNIQLSTSLANTGILINKKINDKFFSQLYSNYQFSDLFTLVNQSNIPDLNSFYTKDLGVNSRYQLSDKITFNTYNYYVEEYYDAINKSLNYSNNAIAQKNRYFSINNIDFNFNHSLFKVSNLIDYSKSSFEYGNINSNVKYKQFFITLSHKYKVLANWTIQYGLDYSKSTYSFDEVLPTYWYALDNQAPTFITFENRLLNYTEFYLYTEYQFNSQFGGSAAVRKNAFTENKSLDLLSGQISGYYRLNNENRFIFGLGQYHNYSNINYFNKNFHLLKSKQIALDYYFEKGNNALTAAVYYKKDQGDTPLSAYEKLNENNILGFEVSYSRSLNKYLSTSISNVHLRQVQILNDKKNKRNMNYYVKANITYNNPKYFTTALVLNSHPGNSYTKVINNKAHNNEYAQPLFSGFNEYNLKDYLKVDFTINRAFEVKQQLLIGYLSVNNIFNRKNESGAYYNNDFSQLSHQYFQRRIIYLGLQYKLDNVF